VKNTPQLIVDRSEGARFYCAACGGTYSRYKNTRQCRCLVYQSADTLRQGKTGIKNRGTGHPRTGLDQVEALAP
jgi:hypothetical protein